MKQTENFKIYVNHGVFMKKIIAVVLLFSLFLLASCGKENTRYRSVDSLAPLENEIRKIIDDPTLVSMSRDDIDFSLDLSPDEYKQGFVLLSTSGASIDEVGIFEARDDDFDSLEEEIESYLEDCKENKEEWLKSYNPTEAEKLKNGRMFRYGNYLLYAFLSEDKTSLVREKTKAFLKEG